MDALSTENLYDGNSIRKKKKREKSKKSIVKHEGQSLDRNSIDAQLVNGTAEGNVIIKKLKNEDKVQTAGQTKIDTDLRKNLAEGNETAKEPKFKDNPQILCHTDVDIGPSLEDPAEGNATVKDTEFPDKVQYTLPGNMNTGPTVNMSEGNSIVKKTKKQRKILKAEFEDEVRNEKDAINLAGGKAMTKKPKIEDEVQQTVDTVVNKIEIGSTENPAHGNVSIENPKIQMENLSQGNGPDKQRKKRKRMKEKLNVEVHGAMHIRSIENLAETNASANMSEIKDEVQSVSQVQMDAGSKENVPEGNVIMENPKSQDEIQGVYQEKMDMGPIQNFPEGNVNVKRRKRRKNDKAKALEEISGRMDARSTENHGGAIVSMSISETRDEIQGTGPKAMDAEQAENTSKGILTVENPKNEDECQGIDKVKIDIGPAMDLIKQPVNEKRKRKRKSSKNTKDMGESMSQGGIMSSFSVNGSIENLAERNDSANMSEIKDEVQSVSQVQMDAGSKENVPEGNVIMENPKSQDEIRGVYQEKMDMGPIQNFPEGNVNVKRRKRRKTDKAKALEEISGRMDARSTENHGGAILSMSISETRDEIQGTGPKAMDAEPAENTSKGIVTVENPKNEDECQGMDKVKIDIGPAMDLIKQPVNEKRKRKRKSSKNRKDVGESTSQGGISSFSVNGSSQVSNENTLDEEIGHNEQRSAISSCNTFTFKDEEALCLKPASIPSIRRKLLVLDLNGLLADIAYSHPEHCKAAIKISKRRSVISRPFYHDFLKFCFENFDVGIWSSRHREIIDRAVDCLLKDQKHKLRFCWDTTYCTPTRFKTLDKRNKPLVCKELRKIWENNDPNCPWRKGDYDESNTLLLDDSPYKALLNPLHTAIFPHPYQYSDENDNSLGPGGDLRVYLEGLVRCENVQKYVEQHPFGQSPITEKNESWEFYKQIIEQVSSNPVTTKPVTRRRRGRGRGN